MCSRKGMSIHFDMMMIVMVINSWVNAKDTYLVGGFAPNGPSVYYQSFNSTFSTYLTAAIQQNPLYASASFTTVPLDFLATYSMLDAGQLDFVFTQPSLFSCIEGEYSMTSLATLRNNRLKKELAEFGGVIFVKKGSDISKLEHLRGRRIALTSFGGLGAGQMQWQLLAENGIDLMQDPSQLVIAGADQPTIVRLVYDGLVDVGFVRTDQIEGMQLRNQSMSWSRFVAADREAFNYINRHRPITLDGIEFPFDSSTRLYPEFSFAAAKGVHWQLQLEVQRALLNIGNANSSDSSHVKRISQKAAADGQYTTFQPSASYLSLRTLQEQLGYVKVSALDGVARCPRFGESAVYEAITCPTGHFKKLQGDVLVGCDSLNIMCPSVPGKVLQCICKPCFKAEEVEVRSLSASASAQSADSAACRKMELCSHAEQNAAMNLTVTDNKNRSALEVTFRLQLSSILAGRAEPVSGAPGTYRVAVATAETGVHLLELFIDGEQDRNSPYLVKVSARDCARDHGADSGRAADAAGGCPCAAQSAEVGGTCVAIWKVVVGAGAACLALLAAGFGLYARRLHRLSEAQWMIGVRELRFGDPPVVLGAGSFGQVVRAEYRGTQVAVKRLLATEASALGNSVAKTWSGSLVKSNSEGSGALARRASMADGGPSTAAADSAPPTIEALLAPSGSQSKSSRRRDFLREIRVLSQLRHPNILTMIGAVFDAGAELLVTELLDHGSLRDLLRNQTVPVDGELALQLLHDVAQGMRYLHGWTPPVIHADLKSSNVLVDSVLRAKVSDFGLARCGFDGGRRTKSWGSALWMAPELLRGGQPTPASDVYSYSIVMTEVLERNDPYAGEDPEAVLLAVSDASRKPEVRPRVPAGTPPAMLSLVQSCWAGDPLQRPAFGSIVDELLGLDPLAGGHALQRMQHQKAARSVIDDAFPPHISKRLLEGRRVEPEEHAMVTAFFADVVGFTTLSAALSAGQVMDMLDRLYTALDALSAAHGVFKIDTIGDAYLVAANLSGDQDSDHVARVARFAIDAVAAAANVLIDIGDPSKGTVALRAGFDCGPAMACVVGTRAKKFVLLGDTVNTASRMESTSLPGRVQCTHRAAGILEQQDPKVPLLHRGNVNIKGKGSMATFWVGGDGGKSECNKQGEIECAIGNAASSLSKIDGVSGEVTTGDWTTSAVMYTMSDTHVLIDNV